MTGNIFRKSGPFSAGGAAAAVLLMVFGAASCSVQQEIVLEPDASGEALLSIDMHPVMTEYIISLKETLDGELASADRKVFDREEIRESFALQPGLELISADIPETGSLRLKIRFVPLDRALERTAPGIRDIFTLSRTGGRSTLSFHLDNGNFEQVARIFPLYTIARDMYLLPDPDSQMSESEYREYLVWALEGVADGQDVGAIIDESMVVVSVRVPGKLVSQAGGSVRGNTVTFRIPVLTALTLQEPLDYRIVYE